MTDLYKQNIGLIVKIAGYYKGLEDIEDLTQEAFISLYRCALLWDPDGGASFASYFAIMLKKSLKRYIDNNGSVIRLPSWRRSLLFRYQAATAEFRNKLQREPTKENIAYIMGLTVDQVEQLKADALKTNTYSTETVLFDDVSLSDMLKDPAELFDAAIDRADNELLAKRLWACVADLPEQQAEVIWRRFQEEKTRKECAQIIGISPESVRGIEYKALRKLRTDKKIKDLQAFLDDMAYSMGLLPVNHQRTGTSSTERAAIRLHEIKTTRAKET